MEITFGKRMKLVFLTVAFMGLALISRTAQSHWAMLEPQIQQMNASAVGQYMSKMYVPPVRKAIIVDGDGLAHPTADNLWMVRKDRSKIIVPSYFYQEEVQVRQEPQPLQRELPLEVKPAAETKSDAEKPIRVVSEKTQPAAANPDVPVTSPEDFDDV
jgi:hypothetical protein